MNNVLNLIEKELIELQEVINKEIREHTKALEDIKIIIDQAQEEKSQAIKESKMIEHKKASSKQREAEDTKEYLESQIQKLENSKLIDKQTYLAKSQQIKKELERINILKAKEIININSKLNVIGKELSEILNKGNDLLKILQKEIYKDNALITPKNEFKEWDIQHTCNIINELPIMEEVNNYSRREQ